MAILPDDLTKRESRAEAGNASGEADSAAPATKALFSRPGSGRGKGRTPRPTSLLPPARSPPPAWPACHCVSSESPPSLPSLFQNQPLEAWEEQHLRMAGPTSTSLAGWEWRKRSHGRRPAPSGEGGHGYLGGSGLGVGDLGAHQSRDTTGAAAQEERREQLLFLCPFSSLTSNLDSK